MKQIVCVLILLVGVFIPGTSLSSHEMGGGVEDIDRSEIREIRADLRHSIANLSPLKAELETLYISMTPAQPEERYLVMHSGKNIENVQAIYRYADDTLGRLLLMKPDRIPYYQYLKENQIKDMRGRVQEYLVHLEEAHGEVSNEDALRAIGQAAETIRSSSELLDRAVEIVEPHSTEKEAPLHHH